MPSPVRGRIECWQLSHRAGSRYSEGLGGNERQGEGRMAFAGRQIGDLTIARALEIITPFDPAAFFPETTPADWAPHESWLKPKAMDAATGALLFPVQSYLVRTAHHTILIDSCVGNDKQRPNRPAWHMKSDDTYMQALHALGVALEDIDFVMCTHMHSDHVGWNTRLVDGRWAPTFPNARYLFTRKELEAWQQGHPKFPRFPLEDSVLPVIAAGQAELVTSDYALDDEVWLEPTPGHTPDHFAICLASRGQRAGHVRRHHALAGAMSAPRVDGVAGLGPGAGQAHPARFHGALRRHRHARLHRAFPPAVGWPHRRGWRRLPL
jgi:glyoxylase-like metal-dependent hydrolase (beta-lactamase superfamily II)